MAATLVNIRVKVRIIKIFFFIISPSIISTLFHLNVSDHIKTINESLSSFPLIERKKPSDVPKATQINVHILN